MVISEYAHANINRTRELMLLAGKTLYSINNAPKVISRTGGNSIKSRYLLILSFVGRITNELHRIAGGDPDGKMRLLMTFAGLDQEVEDPWYTGDFAGVYRQIEKGCRAMLEQLK